jgi:hypothetical protein
MEISTAKTAQATHYIDSPVGQYQHRFWSERFIPTVTIGAGPIVTGITFWHDIVVLGVPATPADVSIITIPRGISGRILRFGIKFDVIGFTDGGWAGGDTEGTISLDRIVQGGAALVNISNLVLPQAAPVAAVINDAEYVQDIVTIAPAAPPLAFNGGDCFYAYTSAIRIIAAAGITGAYTPFIDVQVDNIAQDTDAAVLAYLFAR